MRFTNRREAATTLGSIMPQWSARKPFAGKNRPVRLWRMRLLIRHRRRHSSWRKQCHQQQTDGGPGAVLPSADERVHGVSQSQTQAAGRRKSRSAQHRTQQNSSPVRLVAYVYVITKPCRSVTSENWFFLFFFFYFLSEQRRKKRERSTCDRWENWSWLMIETDISNEKPGSSKQGAQRKKG